MNTAKSPSSPHPPARKEEEEAPLKEEAPLGLLPPSRPLRRLYHHPPLFSMICHIFISPPPLTPSNPLLSHLLFCKIANTMILILVEEKRDSIRAREEQSEVEMGKVGSMRIKQM